MLQTARLAVAGSRQWLSLLVAFVVLAGASLGARAQSGFDVTSVPRPDGAEVATDRAPSQGSITYVYPASVTNTVAATEKSLNAGGWIRYRTPDEERASNSLRFKNGKLGI